MRIDTYDDPIWEYTLITRLQPYIEAVRNFWQNIDSIDVKGTGVYSVQGAPSGLMYRMTSTPVRSPIKGIQIFPFVPSAYLQIANVPGGYTRMIGRKCADNKLHIDEFTIIEKSNLPSTYHQGQFLAFIPTAMLEENTFNGKYVYLTADEMRKIVKADLPDSIKNKLIKYL